MAQAEHLDALVLGSGPGGNLLAWHVSRSGQRLAVVERRYIGGSYLTSPVCRARTRSGAPASPIWPGARHISAQTPARSRPTWRKCASVSASWSSKRSPFKSRGDGVGAALPDAGVPLAIGEGRIIRRATPSHFFRSAPDWTNA